VFYGILLKTEMGVIPTKPTLLYMNFSAYNRGFFYYDLPLLCDEIDKYAKWPAIVQSCLNYVGELVSIRHFEATACTDGGH